MSRNRHNFLYTLKHYGKEMVFNGEALFVNNYPHVYRRLNGKWEKFEGDYVDDPTGGRVTPISPGLAKAIEKEVLKVGEDNIFRR